jgi:hypothetical protein
LFADNRGQWEQAGAGPAGEQNRLFCHGTIPDRIPRLVKPKTLYSAGFRGGLTGNTLRNFALDFVAHGL